MRTVVMQLLNAITVIIMQVSNKVDEQTAMLIVTVQLFVTHPVA